MAELKRVRITVPNVHDGMGGEHKQGDRPVLPADIADLFIAKGMAVPEGELSAEQAKKLAEEQADKVRFAEQKGRASSIMKMHDAQEPETRLAEAFPEVEDEPVAAPKPSQRKNGRHPKKASGNETSPRLRS